MRVRVRYPRCPTVTLATEIGNPLLAAICATAPVTLPLSLYVVVQHANAAAAEDPDTHTALGTGAAAGDEVEAFLLLTCKGMLATMGWCAGALLASRHGLSGSFAGLCLSGYATWAVVWRVLQAL